MLKNYFLTAFRNLARHKFFTIIHVIGLAIGMSISLLLIAMLSFIWTYDTFHEKGDRIYRVITHTDDLNTNRSYASVPAPLAEKLKNEFSGIDDVVRVNATLNGEAKYGSKEIPLSGYFVDSNFLDAFTFPLLDGNAATALEKPNTLVINEAAAQKMFGTADPLGKVISIGNLGDFEITGLLKNHPKNSHMQFEILASYQTLIALQNNQPQQNDWREFRNSYIYILLPKDSDPSRIEAYLQTVSANVYAAEKDFKASFSLQSLNAIAPGPELFNDIGPDWGYASLGIFMLLTLTILVPACFNYSSIAISRALKRMKEIGLRKVMGGQKNQIFFQFIIETVIVALIALVFSFGLFNLIRQEFLNMIVGGAESLELVPDLRTFLLFIAFAILVGTFAGFVPALYFSKLTPIEALKSKPLVKGFGLLHFRKLIMVSQFALSLGFIMTVVIVINQYRYALNFNLGFEKENVLDIALQAVDPEVVRHEFSKLSSVQAVSLSSDIMGVSTSSGGWVTDLQVTDSVENFQMFVDNQYLSNLGLTLLAGKNFTERGDQEAIVNETFLKAWHIATPLEAIDQVFLLPDKRELRIIGVVKDFHFMPLTEPIRSFCFRTDPQQYRYANLKVVTKDVAATMAEMETTWKSVGGESKMEARFFDDEIEEAYSFYFVMIKLCGFLGFLAISLSCLGLLGMVVFTVENRVKEIGVRKVMGASEMSVAVLLSRHFVKLMILGALIATPLTLLFFEKVFFRYHAHRLAIGVSEVLVSLLVMLALGLSTILSQTLRAARANPVDSLRSE